MIARLIFYLYNIAIVSLTGGFPAGQEEKYGISQIICATFSLFHQ